MGNVAVAWDLTSIDEFEVFELNASGPEPGDGDDEDVEPEEMPHPIEPGEMPHPIEPEEMPHP